MENRGEDQSFKFGIMLVGLLVVVLIVIFGAYALKTRDGGIAQSNTGDGQGFFERLFGSDDSEAAVDADGDGLSDMEENKAGTNTVKADSDADGLNDREEKLVYQTDALKADSDSDGMNDGDEIKSRRDPKNGNTSAEWPPRPAEFSTASSNN